MTSLANDPARQLMNSPSVPRAIDVESVETRGISLELIGVEKWFAATSVLRSIQLRH